MTNPISYKGKVYASLKKLVELEASGGLSYAAVANRVRGGWDLEKALCEPKSKNSRKIWKIDNREFNNLKDLAKEAGISYEAAVKRYHRGWSDEEIFHGRSKQKTVEQEAVKQKKTRGKPVCVNDGAYENLRHAFDSIGPSCTFNTVRARLRYGWSLEEALEVKPKVDGRKLNARIKELIIDGVALSALQAANKYGIPYSTVLDRLNRGATPKQALGLENIERGNLLSQSKAYKNRKKREKRNYLVDGVTYNSVAELARAYGLPQALVYNRMRDNGWTAERSVKEEITETVVVQGITYRSSMSAWDEVGKTNFSTYQGRKSQGFPLEVCLGLEPLPTLERYDISGVSYSSLADVAKAFDLTVGQLTSRLKNMTLEQAVIYRPSNGRYSESTFKKNPDLANTPGTLYFIRVALADGVLHKIGITQKETAQRFYSHNIEVISEIKGRLRALYSLEQLIINEFSDLHYRAEDEFEGRTETFLLMGDEEKDILEFISENRNTFGLEDIAPNKALQRTSL
ncbi:GIY-YIG nuclease family protein [Pseudomonas sp. zjy_8]